jgi:hypothetical protein
VLVHERGIRHLDPLDVGPGFALRTALATMRARGSAPGSATVRGPVNSAAAPARRRLASFE